jgi:hypothetical protein
MDSRLAFPPQPWRRAGSVPTHEPPDEAGSFSRPHGPAIDESHVSRHPTPPVATGHAVPSPLVGSLAGAETPIAPPAVLWFFR